MTSFTDQWSSDRESASETESSGSNPGGVKPKTIEIDIHIVVACRSALKKTGCCLHRVR